MKRTISLSCITLLGGVIVLTAGGCGGIVDQQAFDMLMQKLGNTTMTVYPAFVREAAEPAYNDNAAARIGEFLTEDNLATVTVSDQHVPIPGEWGMNQAKMLQESAASFAEYLADNPSETEYALLPEYLIGGAGAVVGIHCYVLDPEGAVAYVVLLNSHHDVFNEGDPKTVDDCTDVLLKVLREDFVPSEAGE